MDNPSIFLKKMMFLSSNLGFLCLMQLLRSKSIHLGHKTQWIGFQQISFPAPLCGDTSKLLPFEIWYLDQLKLQKKSLEKRKGRLKNLNDFRVNDLCMLQYSGLTKVQKRYWSQCTERDLYRFARVNTIGQIFFKKEL